MNCFNFESKQAYMDYVRTLSDEEIVHQRKLMSNLLDDIKYKYKNAKLNIEAIIIPSLKALIKKRNISESNEKFKQLLKEFFNTISIDKDYLEDSNNYFNFIRDEPIYSKEESIKIIENTYNQITTEDGKGAYDKFLSLVTLNFNHTAIVAYRLFNVALIDEEKLKPFLDAPKVLYGGLNSKSEQHIKYSIRRFMFQIQFNLNYVENGFMENWGHLNI